MKRIGCLNNLINNDISDKILINNNNIVNINNNINN